MTTHRDQHQRILVTGAGGFLGRAVSLAAGRAGHDVHLLHRRRGASKVGQSAPVQEWTADLTDTAAVRDVLRRAMPDVIVHCAGYANASRGLAQVEPAVRDNLVATACLMSAAAEIGGIRVVLCGSVEAPGGRVLADQVVPNSPYAASKFAEATYARMFHHLYGLDVSIARLAVVYGPGDARPAKLIPHIVTRLMQGETAELSSGRRLIDWIHIDDAAAGLLACAVRDDLGGRTVDIGTGLLTSVADIARIVAGLLGRTELLRLGSIPDRPSELECAADANATERLIGWRAAVPLKTGLEQTIAWFRSVAPRPQKAVLTVYGDALNTSPVRA
ncbi:NAD-dependent epimerase/dehydratase family protein [Humisphaera borealis]|uniref:NAD(P)-dependent oxidoreductase n=1 Tax=Humisphaera borealis TaxID=2807512 RepID=A0A7M2WWW5_9BACT|nr:NAD(P)-dependent oxidoreductase [Humisphaera borealis]QOV90027.1 NAD(P)-dependent oxidoreductase [Humisphaera borealis]